MFREQLFLRWGGEEPQLEHAATLYCRVDTVPLCLMCSYFLQAYVVTAETAFVVGLVGSYVIFTSYFTFDYYLKQFSTSYRNIPEDKRFYVLSNLISQLHFAYSPLAGQLIPNNVFRRVGFE